MSDITNIDDSYNTDNSVNDSFNTTNRVRINIRDSFNDNSVTNVDNSVSNVTNITNTTTTNTANSYNEGYGFNFGLYYDALFPASNPGYTPYPTEGCFGVSSNPPAYNAFDVYYSTHEVPTLYGVNVIGAYDRDILYGINGNNRIGSGHGQDFMVGNEGADRFILKAAHSTHVAYADVILDFDAYERDTIQLKGIAPNEVFYNRIGVSLDGATVESAVAVMDSRNGLTLGVVITDTVPTFLFCL